MAEDKPLPVTQDELDKYNDGKRVGRTRNGKIRGRVDKNRDSDPSVGVESSQTTDEDIRKRTKKDLNRRYQNPDLFTLPPSTFTMPEMGDYYLGAVDDMYLKKLDQIINDAKPETAEARKAVFYTETPKYTDLGYNDDSVFIKAKISSDATDGNWMNGGAVRVPISSIDAGTKEATNKIIRELDSSKNPYANMTEKDSFILQLYGLSAPKMNCYAYEENVPLNKVNYRAEVVNDIKNNVNYIYDPETVPDNGYCNFVQIGSRWYQMNIKNKTDNTITFSWLAKLRDGNTKEAFQAQQKLKDYIDKANGEVYLQIDRGENLSRGAFDNITSDAVARDTLQDWAGENLDGINNGFCLAKQDFSSRKAGIAYVKIDGKWINLSKAMLTSQIEGVDIDSSFNNSASQDFNQNYDQEAQIFADAYFKVIDELDDRKSIQKEIFGKEWGELHDWTVTIGDVTLLIPPTSITVSSNLEEQRIPLLRANGSMPKSGKRDLRTITMEIYFSGEDSINGYSYKAKSPRGKEFQYSLNGLRALIAEFKFTPFIPIENRYLNEVLGIQAVAFNALHLESVSAIGPKLIQAQVVMTEFDYSVYIPESVVMGAQNNRQSNWFSDSINWPVMRYYYQKCIMAGDKLGGILSNFKDEKTNEIKEGRTGVNSTKYIQATLEHRTALQPMLFESSRIKFYVADENYLEKMLDAKRARKRDYLQGIKFTDNDREAITKIGNSLGGIYEKINGDSFKRSLENILKDKKFGYKDSNFLFDKDSFGDVFLNSNLVLYEDDKIKEPGDKILNEALGDLLSEIKEIDGISYAHFVSDAHVGDSIEENNKAQFGIEIIFKDKNIGSSETIRSVKRNVAPFIQKPEDSFFIDGRVFIPLTLNLEKDKVGTTVKLGGFYRGEGTLKIDENSPDIQFLKYCVDYKKQGEAKKGATAKDDPEWKKAPNLAQLDLMQFVPLDCGNFVVGGFGAQLTNRQSRINLQDVSGSTPQYLGGEDIHFSVSVLTTDEKAASELSKLPKRASHIMRRYREVIPCYPIKVDSEFTRFLGVNEVTISNVNVDTDNQQPGVYRITFTMISAERTLRNREAMQMYEANNSGERFGSVSGVKKVRSYFDFADVIAKAELYPDLELPTLDEMLGLGWEFVRYKFQDSRVYVDPDFYFLYLSQLSSQVLRESVIESIKKGVDGTKTFEDLTGAQFTIKPEKFLGFTTDSRNDILEKQLGEIKKAQSAKYALNSKYLAENLKENRNKLEPEDYETWTICRDIKALFMERRYKKEYESYVSRIRASSIKRDKTINYYTEEQIKNMTEEEVMATAVSELANTKPSEENKDSTDSSQTEGKWVAIQLGNSQTASKKIKDYLENKPIEVEVPDMNIIREKFIQACADGADTKECYDALKIAIQNATAHFLALPEIKEILELLNFELSYPFISTVKDIVFAAACGATGEKEFSGKWKSTNWFPAPDFIGVKPGDGVQDAVKSTVIYSVDEAIENATEFGTFKIKLYTREEFIASTNEEPMNLWNEKTPTVNTSHWLLDRYYRYQPKETIDYYKKGCINSVEFCTFAYLRNVLYWLKNLVDNYALPSINADILRKATNSELQIQEKEAELGVDDKAKNLELRTNIQFFSKNVSSIDAGKIWAAACLASSDGSKVLRTYIHERDYRALNEYVRGCSVPKTPVSTEDKASIMIRKMNLSLIGQNRIKDSDATGVPQDLPAIQHARDFTQKKYIEAAEDPKQFMIHACHDMIVHDARGRMLRAFPTYYMVFIDEGREIGTWRLHDNFYNSMSIMEFTVVKDRKNPADTAIIKLSNMYQAYHTEEEDRLRIQEASWDDTLDSVFSPKNFGKKVEERRKNTSVPDNIRLKAGARIHLRAGYGSNAAMMPVIFNGVIAEITAQDTIDIVAQGDGIELMNPIMEQEDVHDLSNDYTIHRNGGTPKTIMDNLLNYNGGILARKLKDLGRGDLLGDNPFGIYHFGSKEFTDITKNGECCQNIYEAWMKPIWADEESPSNAKDVPSITMDVFGKTVWDVANVCKSVTPDFICSVAPFNMRSTLFIGAPRYYYAYDYTNVNGAIQEKRKPFQQYHIYASGSDIISNGIAASSKKMKTTATGLYQVCSMANIKLQQSVGPIYADIDIYPENQKSMIVDTQYLAKGVPFIGALGLNIFQSSSVLNKIITSAVNTPITAGNTFSKALNGSEAPLFKSNESIAWRMTASALKDSMKEMYCGDLVVMGDPTVKPHDRTFLLDMYIGISGQTTVKEVVHHMSVEDGFITTISPDCINIVDDRFEHIVHSWYGSIAGGIAAHLATLTITGYNVMLMAAGKSDKILTLKKVFNAMKPQEAIDKLANSKYGTKIIEQGGKIAGEVKSGVKDTLNSTKTGSKILKYGGKISEKLGVILTGKAPLGAGGLPGIGFAVAATVGLCAASEIVGPIASTFMNDFMKNLQAITVFPLTRYGLPWTAGMLGSKGAIVGSPSYDEQGALTNLMTSIADPENPILNFLSSIFFSDGVKAMAENLRRKNGYGNSGDSFFNGVQNVVTDTIKDVKTTIQEGAESIKTTTEKGAEISSWFEEFRNKIFAFAGQKGTLYNVREDYRKMQLIPRADFSKEDEVARSYEFFKVADINNFQNDPKLGYTKMISEDRRLKPYIDEGFFKIVHEYPNLNRGKNVDSEEIIIFGEKKHIKPIKYKLKDGNLTYDLPLLNPEAINILYEIIRRAKNDMPTANSSDQYESYEDTKNSFISLESALRVGDTESYAAAGYTFILHGEENAIAPLDAAVEELTKEIKEDYDNEKGYNESLFDYKDLDENKKVIVVRMPKIVGDI